MVRTSILLLMPHFKLTIRYPFCPDDSHTHHLMAIDRIFKVLSLSVAAQKTELLNFIKARLLGNSSLYLSISKEVIDLSLKQNFCHFNRKISQICATQVITWINPNTSVQVFIYLGQRVKLGTKGEKARPVPSSFNQKDLQNVTAPFKKFLHFR